MKKNFILVIVTGVFCVAAFGWWMASPRSEALSKKQDSKLSTSAGASSKSAKSKEPSTENYLIVQGIIPARSREDSLSPEVQSKLNAAARPTLYTSLLNLDLSRPPTELELIQAGNLGDPLSPTAPADPEHYSDPKIQELRKKDNLAFGHAIQTWNEHHYDDAVKMFEKHLVDFPDSPWAAESHLHIGCASQYRGQYDVCQTHFGAILDHSTKGSDTYQKATLRTANILTMQGRFAEAAEIYAESLKLEKNVNRATYASSWLPVLSLYRSQQAAMRDCVQKSLRQVCLIRGQTQAAKQLEILPAKREDGFTAAQVIDLAKSLGMTPVALRARNKDIKALTFPFLAHYKDEHFVAVLSANKDKVSVFDSRVGFINTITRESFKTQWSGFAISLDNPPAPNAALVSVSVEELNQVVGGCCGVLPQPSPTGPPGESSPCATGSNGPPGPSAGGPPTDPIANSDCSPKWWINPVSFNMVVRDVPMWWHSPYGLDVTFSFNFNSQDSLTAVRPFGPKWFLNYCAYAMEDPSGKVTIVAGNTRQWVFTPKAGGGYDAPPDFHCTLVKTGAYEYEVTYLEDGTVYHYGRPAGVNTSASLFLSATDVLGVSVTMTHNSNGALTAVTHSIGGTWNLIYNAAGFVERIDDPFGRSAYMAYDSANALRQVTDMGGLKYSFRYSDSADPVNNTPASMMLMTEIVYAPQELPLATQPNRTWHPLTYRFLTEPADGNSGGTWGRYAVTITRPDGSQEWYYWNGELIPKGFHKTAAQMTPPPGTTTQGTVYSCTLVNGIGQVSSVTYPDGGTASVGAFNSASVPLTQTTRTGVTLTSTVNDFQRLLTLTDPASRTTTFEYAANGMDVTKVTGPDNVIAAQISYNSDRLPIEVIHRDGTKTTMTYNAQQQVLTTTELDANGVTMHSSGCTYDTSHRLQSAQLDGRTVATYTYDAVGRVLTSTDEEGTTVGYVYDSLDRVTKVTYPDGTSEEVAYLGITGMISWQRGRDGQTTLFFYDRRGLLIGVRVPGQKFFGLGYNADMQRTSLIDSNGNVTRWTYDIEGRLLSTITADGGTTTNTYNSMSQLTQQVSPRGLKTILSYDSLSRLAGVDYQTSAGATAFPSFSLTYDLLDRVLTSTDGEGTTTRTYDAVGRLQSVDGPYANDTVSSTFDAFSRVSSVTTPGSIVQTLSYDADGRVSTWADVFGSGSITYQGHTGRVLGTVRAGGLLTSSLAYTPVNDLQKLSQIQHTVGGAVLSQFDYAWNAQQDLASITRTLGSTPDRNTRQEFGYDTAHQLTSATTKQVNTSAVLADQRWGYDPIGNRSFEHDLTSGVRTDYSHSKMNQLVDRKTYTSGQKPWVQGSVNEPGSVALGGKAVPVKGDGTFQGQATARTSPVTAKDKAGNTTTETWQWNYGSGSAPNSTLAYTHDSEGNLLGDGTSSYEWDLKNRLTAIVTGTHRTEFSYDGANRRIRTVEKENGSVQSDKRYVYSGLSLLEERAADNATVLRRFYGSGHVDVSDGGKRYLYTTDHLGSLREVVLLDGTSGNPTTATLVARYDYDAWGKRVVLDGGTAAETLVLLGYTGNVYHKWSGLWLTPFRAYSPALGRWISRDPISVRGGVNLFAYVCNSPTMETDPLGLENIPVFDGPKDFFGIFNRDFAYRAYYNWVNSGNGSAQGYADAMNAANAYAKANSPINSLYAFGGAELKSTRGGGVGLEGIGVVGLDAKSGEVNGGAVLAAGEKGVFGGADWEFGQDGLSPHKIFLAERELGHEQGAGVWKTGDEAGMYFFVETPNGAFVGIGASFDLGNIKNLLNPRYWSGNLPTPAFSAAGLAQGAAFGLLQGSIGCSR